MLSVDSMTLTKTCITDMYVKIYDRTVLKFVTLPEKNQHKKKIRIRYDPVSLNVLDIRSAYLNTYLMLTHSVDI